ncbi:hypothetical protein KBD08_00785 [Candidatus Babeliales bacterium]|nr:hypothetical protein [Candidatus Babeliales bacterium]
MDFRKYLIVGLMCTSWGFAKLQAAEAAYEPRVVFENEEEPATAIDPVWHTDWKETYLQALQHDQSAFRTLKNVDTRVMNEKSFQDLKKRVDTTKQVLINKAKSIGLDEQDPAIVDIENQASDKKSMLEILKQQMVDEVNHFNDHFPMNLELHTPQGKQKALALFGLKSNYTQQQLDQAYQSLKNRLHFNTSALYFRAQDASERSKIIELNKQRLTSIDGIYAYLTGDLGDRQPVGLSAKQEQSSVRQSAEQPKQFGVAKTLDEQKEELPKKEDVKVEPLPKVYQDPIAPVVASDMQPKQSVVEKASGEKKEELPKKEDVKFEPLPKVYQDPVAPVVSVAPKMIKNQSDSLWNVDFESILKLYDDQDISVFCKKMLEIDPQFNMNNYLPSFDGIMERLINIKRDLEKQVMIKARENGLNAEDDVVKRELSNINKQYQYRRGFVSSIRYRISNLNSAFKNLHNELGKVLGDVDMQKNLNAAVTFFEFKNLHSDYGESKDSVQNRLREKYEQSKKILKNYQGLIEGTPTYTNKQRDEIVSLIKSDLEFLDKIYNRIKENVTSFDYRRSSRIYMGGIRW